MPADRQAARLLFVLCFCSVLAGCETVRQGRRSGDALSLSSQEREFASSLAHFSRALLLEGESKRNTDRVLEHYAEALRLTPGKAVLYTRLGHSAIRAGNLDQATSVLEEGCRECPDNAHLRMELAAVHQLAGRGEDAQAKYLEALERDASLTYAYMAIALLCFRDGRDADAFDALELGLVDADKPRHLLRTCHEQGAKLLRAHELTRAISCFEFVAEHEPMHRSEIYHIIGEIHRGRRDMQSAGRYYKRATEADNPIPDAYVKLALLQHAEDPQKAIETLTAAITRIPGTPELLHILGEMYRKAGQTDEAIASLTKATRQDPPLPQAFIGLAMLHLEDDPDRALAIIEQAAERLPEHATILLLLANMYSFRERFDDAVRIYRRVETVAQNDQTVGLTQNFYLHYGGACERAGQNEDAERIFLIGIEKHPDAHQMRNYLAYMWAEKARNLDQALTHINHALELDPENGAYIDTLGWIYYQQERYPEALEQLRKALDHIDDDPVLHDHMGDVLDKLGKTEEAAKHWKKSFIAAPESKAVRDKLTHLGVDMEALELEAARAKQESEKARDEGGDGEQKSE